MFKVSLVLLLAVSISFSQWGVTGGVYLPKKADGATADPPTFIGFGVRYKVVDEEKMSVNLISQYAFASQDIQFGTVSFSATYGLAEFGANLNYQLADALSGVVTAVFSSPSVTITGVTLTAPESEFTIAAGAAYMLGDALFLEAGYAITGSEGVRAGLGYNF